MTDKELRELDIQVAKVVFGMEWQGGNPIAGLDGRWPWPPPYSTDMNAAWEVVAKLIDRFDSEPFICESIAIIDGVRDWHVFIGEHGEGSGATPAIAICWAAIGAVEAMTR